MYIQIIHKYICRVTEMYSIIKKAQINFCFHIRLVLHFWDFSLKYSNVEDGDNQQWMICLFLACVIKGKKYKATRSKSCNDDHGLSLTGIADYSRQVSYCTFFLYQVSCWRGQTSLCWAEHLGRAHPWRGQGRGTGYSTTRWTLYWNLWRDLGYCTSCVTGRESASSTGRAWTSTTTGRSTTAVLCSTKMTTRFTYRTWSVRSFSWGLGMVWLLWRWWGSFCTVVAAKAIIMMYSRYFESMKALSTTSFIDSCDDLWNLIYVQWEYP